MKLTIRGYEPLIIPKEAIVPMKGSFDGQTPYIAKVAARWKQKSYIEKKLPLKILCLESIRDRAEAEGKFQSYSDPMAGIGISARIFGQKRFKFLNDLDVGCVQVLKRNFHAVADPPITSYDIMTADLSPAGMVFLDFNDFTMKRCLGKYRGVMGRAFETAKTFLVINDCSPFYLRYGPAAFEVYSKLMESNIKSVGDYFRQAAVWYKKYGWHLIQVNYFSETSFLLLSKRKSKLWLNDMRTVSAPAGMIKVEED